MSATDDDLALSTNALSLSTSHRRNIAPTTRRPVQATKRRRATLWTSWISSSRSAGTASLRSYPEDCAQAMPLVGLAYARLIGAAFGHSTPDVDALECGRWFATLLRAAGSRLDDAAPAWRLDPAPLCCAEAVVRASLFYARACLEAVGVDGRAEALGYLSLAARQCRIEHGDDLERFWARWTSSFRELEPLREPLAELLREPVEQI